MNKDLVKCSLQCFEWGWIAADLGRELEDRRQRLRVMRSRPEATQSMDLPQAVLLITALNALQSRIVRIAGLIGKEYTPIIEAGSRTKAITLSPADCAALMVVGNGLFGEAEQRLVRIATDAMLRK